MPKAAKESRSQTGPRLELIRKLLQSESIGAQEDFAKILLERGFDCTQSTISRDLRRLGAVRGTNASGFAVYRLPSEPYVPNLSRSLRDHIVQLCCNDSLIVIRTIPGSAQLIARHLDRHGTDSSILGTLAGDDTVFVALASGKNAKRLMKTIEESLSDH